MNPDHAFPYRQELQAQRTALLAQIAQQRGGVVSRAEAAADHFGHAEDSRAQVTTERELAFALDERETAELEAIDATLHRIEAGTYGDCIDCGACIAPARLQASPEAARCIHCQEKAERRHAA